MLESVEQVLCHPHSPGFLGLGEQVWYPLGRSLLQVESIAQSVVDYVQGNSSLGSNDTDAGHVVLSKNVLYLLQLGVTLVICPPVF